MKKRIVLCADDYGQALAISQGILHLIQIGRLSATSCMVNLPHWPQHAEWLLSYQHKIDIGLHFNLTSGQPLSREYAQIHGDRFFHLPLLLRKAFLHRLEKKAIEAECDAQISYFCQAMGFLPHYIDGHQHVHHFPVIRDAIVSVYEQRLRQQKSYIRWVNERIKAPDMACMIKKIIIHAAGTRALKRQLTRHQIPHNQFFAGIYSFGMANRYTQLFPGFLQEMGDKGLLMCHPGLASSDTSDSIAGARYSEYQYLSSPKFLADCEAHEVVIGRFHKD